MAFENVSQKVNEMLNNFLTELKFSLGRYYIYSMYEHYELSQEKNGGNFLSPQGAMEGS